MLIETRAVLTGGPEPKLIPNAVLHIEKGVIQEIRTRAPRGKKVIDFSNRVAIPGFVQTHIHLCQTGMRGKADDLHLLDWLQQRIFPYENSLTPKTLRASVSRGITELLLSGTTCVMDMGTMRHTEVIAKELAATGIRAYFGKCLMDHNPAFEDLSESTMDALNEAKELASKWHKKTSRLRYAFTPRFILSCTDELMVEAHRLTEEFPDSRLHTHASENPHEMDAVRSRCNMDNVEYLDHLGILSQVSCLAHCVHLTEREVKILKDRFVSVMHCPSSNLKLASGIADITRFLKEGITVSLGCDGAACNNQLDMFTEMRLASLLQKPKHGAEALPAKSAFQIATYGGAKTLGWEKEIGSVEEGKAADLVFLDLDTHWMPEKLVSEEDYYSAIVYCGRPTNVTDVMIEGDWVVRRAKCYY
jgi:5-methylthioadenosine/S-adenosylhomocysteine deaminase